ncbi:Putative uncharacterized protein [Taphrina deformans PYCC 5710]|uniref:SUN domain-containing protein n=1 Tax=Taphrina deformans (strain PYCC 5710 / ATCC 11124 / CBS 356.35 / IMI 108563 / JCM 9778 / NBRC 8474) TaxID=1097556 RepID=R4X738_TAPDE|nr:Putative uncharacterized protein [Taphrina deformans PYCC 5710]|eukprot:CCG81061.1 Putative uncharacterized protein [Taphrina deformans PYCC 5710]
MWRIYVHWGLLILAPSCENVMQSLVIQTYPSCLAPSSIARPLPTQTLEEQLQATLSAQEAKFLSFEEWKARNLNQQGSQIISRTIEQASASTSGSQTRQSTNEEQVSNASPTANEPSTSVSIFTAFTSTRTAETIPEDDVPSTRKKDRFNHASFDCAASIVQSNKESKGSSNILKENKDYYMLNTCSAPSKFVTIELCNDILVDTIQLANFEYFSGVFKDITVQVAAKYPPGREGWQELGKFKARPIREIQTFRVDNPLIWARYVRVEMDKFYGNEFYCPLSLVRVFGKTMMEDYKQEGTLEDEAQIQSTASETTSNELFENIERAADDLVAFSDQLAGDMQKHGVTAPDQAVIVGIEVVDSTSTSSTAAMSSDTAVASSITVSQALVCVPRISHIPLTYSLETNPKPLSTSVGSARFDSAKVTQTSVVQTRTSNSTTIITSVARTDASALVASASPARITDHDVSQTGRGEEVKQVKVPHHSSIPTQESIYKQITKRLSLLEANATLSLRYIESQSSLLAQSFSQLSSAQARHLADFLENVNITMLQRISQLKQEYEYLYSDVAKSMDSAQQRQEGDMTLVSHKLGMLGDDITFFKRLGMFQSVLMVILLGFLVTSRSAGIEIQSSFHRALTRRSASGLHSPITRAGSPTSWRYHFRDRSTNTGSIYSFPVEQIERPFQSNPQSPFPSSGFDHGAHVYPSSNNVVHSDCPDHLRGSSTSRPSSRSKDDMYDRNTNSVIRQRLYRGTSWTAEPNSDPSAGRRVVTHNDVHLEKRHKDDPADVDDGSEYTANGRKDFGYGTNTNDDHGTLDYPTPRPEDD